MVQYGITSQDVNKSLTAEFYYDYYSIGIISYILLIKNNPFE